ncbi:helix-turn-helix domain-containing protein, partial [Campylobacter lari]
YARLVDPRHAAQPASQVAAHFGFRDMARFRKSFIARFGLAPDEASDSGRRGCPPATDGDNALSSHFSAHSRP